MLLFPVRSIDPQVRGRVSIGTGIASCQESGLGVRKIGAIRELISGTA